MLFGLYIANKLRKSKEQSFSKTVISLATIAVSLSITVVILSCGILFGFKKEIRDKVSGYAGHISIRNYDLSKGSENTYLQIDSLLTQKTLSENNIASVKPYINKAGILKSDSVLEGLIFRGLPHNYDFSFYKKHLLRGNIPEYTDNSDSYDILISSYTAAILGKDTGDQLDLYFIEDNSVKRRKPKIIGIFNTGLGVFDKQFAIADLRMIQRVVSANYSLAMGYEVKVHDFDILDETVKNLEKTLNYKLRALSVKEQYDTIFQWLSIVDTNVLIIIVLMFIVAFINIITVLLILIIERIPMIGLLKAVGANHRKIMHIFSWQGLFILGGGLVLGNAVALGAAWLQTKYQFITLSPETYYMNAVPFHLPPLQIIGINLATVVLAYFFTLIPSILIGRISPSRSLQFK